VFFISLLTRQAPPTPRPWRCGRRRGRRGAKPEPREPEPREALLCASTRLDKACHRSSVIILRKDGRAACASVVAAGRWILLLLLPFTVLWLTLAYLDNESTGVDVCLKVRFPICSASGGGMLSKLATGCNCDNTSAVTCAFELSTEVQLQAERTQDVDM